MRFASNFRYKNIDDLIENGLKYSNDMYEVDPKIITEMKDFFFERNNRHIDLVKKYCKKIYDSYGDEYEGIIERGEDHDASKFKDPEMEPYILTTWDYKCKDDGTDSGLTEEDKKFMDEATDHHVNNNSHHPEYHSKVENKVNREDRDAPPDKSVDGTGMGTLDIAEMCADWCAMSEEKGTNTPHEWAKKNIGVRWDFDTEQVDLIYDILDTIWK